MNDETHGVAQGQAMIYVPTLGDRMARLLGFQHQHGDEPDGVETWPGWGRTELRIDVSFLDRVRLVFGGRLHVSLTHYADKPFDRMKNRVDIFLPAPWWHDR